MDDRETSLSMAEGLVPAFQTSDSERGAMVPTLLLAGPEAADSASSFPGPMVPVEPQRRIALLVLHREHHHASGAPGAGADR